MKKPFFLALIKNRLLLILERLLYRMHKNSQRNFAAKKAAYLDAPVTGGTGGAAKGKMRIFIGGKDDAKIKVHPILEALAEEKGVINCGPSGMGQVVKGVNQLAMGLTNAALMEAASFGSRFGLSHELMEQCVGGRVVGVNCFQVFAGI